MAGEFLTTGPPGKSLLFFFTLHNKSGHLYMKEKKKKEHIQGLPWPCSGYDSAFPVPPLQGA